MSATFNRKAIMEAAHFMARWREGTARPIASASPRPCATNGRKPRPAPPAAITPSRLRPRPAAPLLPRRRQPTPTGAFAGVRLARRLFTSQSGRLAGSFAG